MNMLQICGVAVLTVILALILKQMKSSAALFVSIAGGLIVLVFSVASLAPALNYLREAVRTSAFSSYAAVLLKALGIAFTVQITADICRDLGEAGVAAKVELLGKAEILLLSLPLLKEVISLATSLF